MTLPNALEHVGYNRFYMHLVYRWQNKMLPEHPATKAPPWPAPPAYADIVALFDWYLRILWDLRPMTGRCAFDVLRSDNVTAHVYLRRRYHKAYDRLHAILALPARRSLGFAHQLWEFMTDGDKAFWAREPFEVITEPCAFYARDHVYALCTTTALWFPKNWKNFMDAYLDSYDELHGFHAFIAFVNKTVFRSDGDDPHGYVKRGGTLGPALRVANVGDNDHGVVAELTLLQWRIVLAQGEAHSCWGRWFGKDARVRQVENRALPILVEIATLCPVGADATHDTLGRQLWRLLHPTERDCWIKSARKRVKL